MSLAKEFLVVALVWFTVRLLRSPRDLAIGVLVGCLVLRLVSAPSTIVAIHEFAGGTLNAGNVKLVQNVLLDISWFCLLLFFLLSAGGTRRRAWVEALVLAAVCVTSAISMLAIPADVRAQDFAAGSALPQAFPEPEMAWFYLIDAGYGAYVTLQAGAWALRDAAESPPRVRWGLRVATAGLVLLAASAAGRFTAVVVRWTGGEVSAGALAWTNSFVHIGVILFMAGITLVGILAAITASWVWLRNRRRYQDLRPLWDQLHDVFPDDALYAAPNHAWLDRVAFWRVHRRYWRRVVEIRDGLVRLSPYLADCGFTGREERGKPPPDIFREALTRVRSGERPTSRHAVLVARPDRPDLEADVGELVALSRALKA
ncbi:MAB_1171c family putative transporter [Amycolatopsis sp. lyj-112]|uniref:MAB_1171c family putative transporter n=1 Tax=Amycolatopsis sp. lyj-112 TaxID=2789288 RepID=UPI00397A295F